MELEHRARSLGVGQNGAEHVLNDKKLGKRIADHRRLVGLTQAELAEKVSVASETINRLERAAAIPSLSRLESVASALGVELHELFRFREPEAAKERMLEHLVSLMRSRSTADIEVIAAVSSRVLGHWKFGSRHH